MNRQLVLAPQPTVKRIADLEGPDFYPTPRWATVALVRNEEFVGEIWEPACGDGAMSQVLEDNGNRVFSSDLFDRGFGVSGLNFLNSERETDNIVTNPPFHSAEAFVHKGLTSSTKKLALLLRLAFLEGGRRQRNIFNVTPPSRVWVFSERITFYPKDAERKGSGTTAYAWFVWDKKSMGSTELRWLPLGLKSKS